MAASMQKLSHKQYRALLKKQKRKQKRQETAKLKEEVDEPTKSFPGILRKTEEEQEKKENELLQQHEFEREKAHQAWLQRERIAQIVFERKKQQEREWKQQQEEAERKIEEELERQKNMEEKFLNSKNKKTTKEKLLEDALHILSDGDDPDVENGNQPTHNPEAPKYLERKQEDCMFYLKTGTCRFGNRCSRYHAYPIISTTLLIRGMFNCYAMEQSYRDEYDADIGLEFDEMETQNAFLEFYDDVLQEFKKAGKVMQFKVCKNWETHLRGNVYIEFETESGCSNAFTMFNARFYAGKQLSCEYCPVTNWKAAICGLFYRKKCPKGKNCNFLHVFRNPGNEFAEADRGPGMWTSQRGGWPSQRSHIGTPMGSERSFRDQSRWYARNESRERHTRRHRSRERYRSRSRERHRSKGRERHRSRSRERHRSRSRERHRSRSRERHRSRSKGRHRKGKRGGSTEKNNTRKESHKSISRSRSNSRDRSKSKSVDRKQDREHTSRSRSKSRSPNVEEVNSYGGREKTIRRSRSDSKERVYVHKHSKYRDRKDRDFTKSRSRSSSYERELCSERSRSSKRSKKKNLSTEQERKSVESSSVYGPKAPPDQEDRCRSSSRESEESQMACEKKQRSLVDSGKQVLERKDRKKHKKSKHKKHKKNELETKTDMSKHGNGLHEVGTYSNHDSIR